MAKPKQKKYDAINQMLDGDIIFEDTREPSAAVKLITLISKIIVVVVISGLFCFYVVLFFTGGCKLVEELEIHEDGYFQYIILGESGPYSDNDVTDAVAIIGFSALGRQQEVIDFPKEIDGKPVCYIGYRDWNTFTESFFHLESDNLKKVYIHENIKSVYPEAFYYFRENEYVLRNEVSVLGDYYYRAGIGEYEAHLVAKDRGVNLVDVRMTVPTEALAKNICDNWQRKNQEIYRYLTEQLF